MRFDSQFGHGIAQCEQKIQYTFTNKLLSAVSLNNAGPNASVYIDNGEYKTLSKNDRLAVYGNSIATAMLCQDWYHKNSSKAIWTSIRNEALSNNFLAETGFSYGLDLCVHKDPATVFVSSKMMATAVEAILGAVHLDGGDAALRRVLAHLHIVSQYEHSVMF
ncbi:Ribonuclease III [Cordyceps fumosorosea ARSEF 2679]|uniref:Ribonuclease III n=1 Tax=Cordyceps fumosorosea (strain ARSEF 2679) TaxID=1081104 RepID=A0A162J796_CORFA|nr:Ribonuclease III [Cordyceps fumosorosea ARSEF 2679]OAA64772.1 Ribonuclease III [Cordyceps fumosorosea ARSEF 2679]